MIIETLDKWATDGTLILAGLITLVGIFIACFFLKTAWGAWDNRSRQDEIYGKPGANLDEKKHRTRQER